MRSGREPLVIDGPFAETKEQLLGFYVVDCATLEEAIEAARELGRGETGALEIRPLRLFQPGSRRRSDRHRLDRCGAERPRGPRRSARCCAISATSTEPRRPSRRPACARCKNWPVNGPPRDPAAWLILVGRNAALDDVAPAEQEPARCRRTRCISDLDDAEADLAERLDSSHYRDDVLRLLFICCHPDLPATQQIALALRIVSGLSVKEIARAFLVSESAMEQRITRAKRRVAEADVPFETPGAVERAERLAAVAAMIYLLFNEGYSASGGTAHVRVPLCEEAIRLARLLLRLFPSEPEIMGLTALLLLCSTRARRRGSMRTAASCCWRTRIAACGTAT